jgi:hypothetical protein
LTQDFSVRARLLRLLPPPALAAAFVCVATLSGCGHVPFIGSSGDESAAACPAAAVLKPLSQTAIFTRPDLGMRPTDVVYYGILSEVDAKCSTNGDTLHASLDVVIAAERGPATRGDSVDLTYFLAVVGPGENVLSKTSYGVRVEVPHDAKRGGINDHFETNIPLGGQAPGALQIVAGFQQSPQVVDFYQHFRGR